MASCVLLLLLVSWLCCCRWCRGCCCWCRGCLQQLSPCFLLSFYEQCEKEKAASPYPERTNLCFFAAVGISFCVSSILLLLGGLILR